MDNRDQVQAVSSASTERGGKAVRDGRDARGRFAAGNPGGPGNPLAKYYARVRRAFRETIDEEEIKALIRKLYEQACAGHVGAAYFIATYCGVAPAHPAASAPAAA
jgi:hypothetical protein